MGFFMYSWMEVGNGVGSPEWIMIQIGRVGQKTGEKTKEGLKKTGEAIKKEAKVIAQKTKGIVKRKEKEKKEPES